MNAANRQKKETTKTKTESTPKTTGKTTTTNNTSKDFDKIVNQSTENEDFEGDEREWETPDVKPKYPTDVQAGGKLSQADTAQRTGVRTQDDLEANERPSQTEMADYAMNQDDETDSAGADDSSYMIRH